MKKILLLGTIAMISLSLQSQINITVNTSAKRQTIRGMGCQPDGETAAPGQPTGNDDDLLYDLGASSFRVFSGYHSDNYHWSEPVNDNNDANVLDLTKFIFLPDANVARRIDGHSCIRDT